MMLVALRTFPLISLVAIAAILHSPPTALAQEPPAPGQPAPRNRSAVEAALDWLAEHQSPDGGWTFDHRGGKCAGRCRNHGNLADARIAATGLALLPFLGAGVTNKEEAHTAKFNDVVKKGLDFLRSKMKVKEGEYGDLTEPGGTMYSHGIASVVLCEAYAMSKDKELREPAQLALNYIVASQDPVGGGWRYAMKQPGDTSVLGWQLMALKSGHLAKLTVPPATIKLAASYLESVQTEGGSQYGYTGPIKGRGTTTAIGLLGRLYTGWDRERPAMIAGVKVLSDLAPSKTDLYYDYFATMLMRHNEGEPWTKWNAANRDQFIASRTSAGHEDGSWFMEGNDPGAKAGGRLYCTAMATMNLEVYYRHLSLYRQDAYRDNFGLEPTAPK